MNTPKLRYTLVRVFKLRATHTIKEEIDEHGLPLLHGHNYDIEVHLAGNSSSGDYTFPSPTLVERVVNDRIISAYDKTHLNNHFQVATGEYLSLEFFKILKDSELALCIKKIVVNETRKNRFLTEEV